jgi:molecular chaperone GrpE
MFIQLKSSRINAAIRTFRNVYLKAFYRAMHLFRRSLDGMADAVKDPQDGDTGEEKKTVVEALTEENSANPPVEEKVVAAEPEPPVDSLDDLKRQLEEHSDRYLRLMAEFDNFKKRISRDYERLVESANEKLISELIEVRQNFERAVKTGESANDAKSLFEGMKLIFMKFDEVLSKNGLEPFGAPGELFDPQVHDALMKSPHADIAEDHIAEVFEKGYYLKKRVLRHARVVVSSGKPEEKKDVGKE